MTPTSSALNACHQDYEAAEKLMEFCQAVYDGWKPAEHTAQLMLHDASLGELFLLTVIIHEGGTFDIVSEIPFAKRF